MFRIMDKDNLLSVNFVNFNPSGVCYVKPEQPIIRYREPAFSLDNENRVLFRGSLFAWNEDKYGKKYGIENCGYVVNLLNMAYKLGVEDK